MATQEYLDELDAVVQAVQSTLPGASFAAAGDDYIVLSALKSTVGQPDSWFNALSADYLLVTGSVTDALFSGSNGEQLQLGDTEHWMSLKVWLQV